jgi:hypothetical protein
LATSNRSSLRPGRRLRLTVRELRGQLVVLVVVLWTVAAVNACTPTRYLRSGHVKGTDFILFYTLGSLAARGHVSDFDDFDTTYRLQVSLVPESLGLLYPSVYGPQIALALSPLGHLSYEGALLTWLGLSALVYLTLLRYVATRSATVRPYLGTALLGAIGFPPFWQLLQHGQLSVVALVAIVGAWSALRKGREGLAGICLGLLAYKPQLVAPVLILLVLSRSWRMAGMASVSGAAQLLVAGVWVGWTGLTDYATLLASLPGAASQLASRPGQMHSLRTFWDLLVPWGPAALVLYGVSVTAVLAIVARTWHRLSDPSLKMSVLSIAVVLVAPHVFVYDLILLAPAWIWLTEWFARVSRSPAVARLLYAGYLAPLAAPFVPFIRVQLLTVCLCALLIIIAQWASLETAREPSGSDHAVRA